MPITTVLNLMNMLSHMFKNATGFDLQYEICSPDDDIVVKIDLGGEDYIRLYDMGPRGGDEWQQLNEELYYIERYPGIPITEYEAKNQLIPGSVAVLIRHPAVTACTSHGANYDDRHEHITGIRMTDPTDPTLVLDDITLVVAGQPDEYYESPVLNFPEDSHVIMKYLVTFMHIATPTLVLRAEQALPQVNAAEEVSTDAGPAASH